MNPCSEYPIMIGIAGGSGAGKTTFTKNIVNCLGEHRATSIPYDSYYRDRGAISPEERDYINFDHPNALDTDLLLKHLNQLKDGQTVDTPVYDFRTHTRTNTTRPVPPRSIILVEGILTFTNVLLRELFDLRIFLEADPDVRFIRRLRRDIAERGRTVEMVIDQWLQTVQPMYLEFVEPFKRQADVIFPLNGHNNTTANVISYLFGIVNNRTGKGQEHGKPEGSKTDGDFKQFR